MGFGLDQLSKPTPHAVSVLFDFLIGFCGIVSGFITSAAFISHSVSDVVSSILTALIIPILLLAKRLFGVDTEIKSVPVSEVSEIKKT